MGRYQTAPVGSEARRHVRLSNIEVPEELCQALRYGKFCRRNHMVVSSAYAFW
jgi:hypothetical protein